MTSGNICGCHDWGLLLGLSGWRAGVLLGLPQCPGRLCRERLSLDVCSAEGRLYRNVHAEWAAHAKGIKSGRGTFFPVPPQLGRG